MGTETVVSTPQGAYVLPGRPGQRRQHSGGTYVMNVHVHGPAPSLAQMRGYWNQMNRMSGVAAARG